MRDKRMKIYLDDHLALMVAEVELAHRCRRSNRRTPLGEFLCELENEVQAQKAIAQDVFHRIGGRSGIDSRLKRGAALFVERLGRFKLNDSLWSYSDLSRVIELETLSSAAQGRICLWNNLDLLAESDPRLDGITFSYFRSQSQKQLDELQMRARFAAAVAFVGCGEPT